MSAPPPAPSLPLFAFPLGVPACMQLFSTSALRHLAVKQSAALTIPWYHFPAVLAAEGHSTVSTPNSKERGGFGRLPLGFKQLDVFLGRPSRGFSQPAIVPNIIRRVRVNLSEECFSGFY